MRHRAKAILLAIMGLSSLSYTALTVLAPEQAGQRMGTLPPGLQAFASGGFGLLLLVAALRLWRGSRRRFTRPFD